MVGMLTWESLNLKVGTVTQRTSLAPQLQGLQKPREVVYRQLRVTTRAE